MSPWRKLVNQVKKADQEFQPRGAVAFMVGMVAVYAGVFFGMWLLLIRTQG